ncbi:MAG: oxidoreductase, partial [Propionibacteriaceae bacterium]
MVDPLADLARLEGVPSAVVSARDAVDAVLRDRGMRAISAEQSATALLLGARASAALTDDPDRWLAGSVRLSTELITISELIRVSPGQAMARAHTLVAHGQVPDDELGRVRSEESISARMRGLNTLLTATTEAPALILAAVAHAEIATIGPFGTADTIIARAVEHLVLIASGVDPRAVIVPEAGHLELEPAYRDALVGYQSGTVAGVRDWLLHCTRALSSGAELSPAADRLKRK